MKWKRKPEATEPFDPATDAQIGSICHNLQFLQPGDPEWDTALGMLKLAGPPDTKESYSRVSTQQATDVIAYLRSFG